MGTIPMNAPSPSTIESVMRKKEPAVKRRRTVKIRSSQPMETRVEVEAYSEAQAIRAAWFYRDDHSYVLDRAGYDDAEAIEIPASEASVEDSVEASVEDSVEDRWRQSHER
jgi:hypothetical protein